jgi:hypothetical protein
MIRLICFEGADWQEGHPVNYVSSCVHACTLLPVAILALQATLCVGLLLIQAPLTWRFVTRMAGIVIGLTPVDNLASAAFVGGRLQTIVIRQECCVQLALRYVRMKSLRKSPSGIIQRAER